MRNKITGIIAVASAVLTLTGCAGIHRTDGTKLTTVSVSDAKLSAEKWEEVGEQIAAGKEVVIRIMAGQALPLKLNLVLPMTKLVAG